MPTCKILAQKAAGQWQLRAPLDEAGLAAARGILDAGVLDGLEDGTRIEFGPEPEGGGVTLSIQGSRADVVRVLRWAGVDERAARPRRLSPRARPPATLTPAQEDAIRRAVALGYYQIPRSIHLGALAAKLNVSQAALSERLRRAEARLITHYTDRRDEASDGAED